LNYVAKHPTFDAMLSNPPLPADIAPPDVVTDAQLRDLATAVGLNRAAPGRCSRVFLFQLYCSAFASNVFGDPAKIVVEILSLEGVGPEVGTKPAEIFKKPPLLGLWKKHYLVGGLASLALNIKLESGKHGREFKRIARKHYNPETANLPKDVIARNIAQDAVALYAERSLRQGLTGQWIVYARHEGKNYYLCLAGHEEGDPNIFERIKNGCAHEFSFLGPQLGP